MQSTLLLGYILIPLTCGLRTYQNSMLGKFNPNVPVPNYIPGFNNMHQIKKTIQEHIRKVNEEIELGLSSGNIKAGNFNRDIPGHGFHNNAFPPTKLRQPNGDETINAPSSKAFEQYFPVPPFAKLRGGKSIFNHRRREYDVPIELPREYSSPPIGKAVREEYNEGMVRNNGYNGGNNGYNGGNNGYSGGNNGYNGGNNGYNVGNTGYNGGNNGYNGRNNGYNGGINGYNGGNNGYNGGNNGYNGGNKGYNGGNNGYNGENNGYNGGNNGYNGGNNGYNGGNNGYNGGNKGYNGRNNGYNGKNNDDNQDIAVKGGVIKDLTTAEKWWALTGTTLDQDLEEQDLNEKYLIFIKSFKGNEIEKGSLGLDIEELASIGYNGGSNGFNGGTTGINGGSTGINGGNNGINGGSNGISGGNNGINGGLNGFPNEAKKALRQGYNIQYTGMKPGNKRNNREERGNNIREYNNYGNTNTGENFKYYNDVPAYAKIIKAIPPEKSTVWTKKPLNLNQKRQELEQQYKRTLDMLNGKIFGIENYKTVNHAKNLIHY